jgi:hypothetical protein
MSEPGVVRACPVSSHVFRPDKIIGHQQRAGRQGDPVAEIRHPRRSQQPAETAAKTRWRDELGEPVHYYRPSALARVPLSRLGALTPFGTKKVRLAK